MCAFKNQIWIDVDIEGEISVKNDNDLCHSARKGQHLAAKNSQQRGPFYKDESSTHISRQEDEKSVLAKQLTKLNTNGGITLTVDSLADLVYKIIKQRENETLKTKTSMVKKDTKDETEGLQTTVKGELDMFEEIINRYTAQGIKDKGKKEVVLENGSRHMEYDVSSIPLEKIPSRPGLQDNIVWKIPPPKP